MPIIPWEFVANLVVGAALSYLLKHLYVRYGRTFSDRRTFSRHFVPLTLVTTFIISVIRSSLALSLGLVGALSIIRFRSAIKEPEELIYIFIAMTLGLGLGANQRTITVIAFVAISLIVALEHRLVKHDESQNLLLSFSNQTAEPVNIERLVDTLRKHCSMVDLRRFDQDGQAVEISFMVGVDRLEQLTALRNELAQIDRGARICFLDSSSLL